MPSLRAAGLLLFAAALPACTGPESAIESAHAVFMTRPGCPYVVTNMTAARFAVLAPRDGYTPRQGDLLVGNLRVGALTLGVAPFGAEEITETATFEVAGHGLGLAEAQDLFYGLCPPSPDTLSATGLAPEAVPSDASDAF